METIGYKFGRGMTFIGWGLIGEPQEGILVDGPSGPSLDVHGYNVWDYWDNGYFKGPDIYGVTPVYQTVEGQFPPDAVQYPYLA